MTPQSLANGIVRAILILASVVIGLYFIYAIRSVIAYVVIAAVVALIGRPVMLFLRKKLKFPNTLAVITVILIFLGLLFGIASLFIPLLTQQGKNLSLLDLDNLKENLSTLYLEISSYLGASPDEITQLIKHSDVEKTLLSGLDIGFIPNLLNGLVDVLSSMSIGLFSVLFIAFFFLKDSHILQRSVLLLVPEKNESGMLKSIRKIKTLLSRYFVGLILQILVLFVIYTTALLLIGIKDAIVIAFLCALFNIIPYIGPMIGAILMVVLAMTSNLGADFSSEILPDVGWVLVGLVVGQLVDNLFSQPIIFSNSVKSHPLEIFLVILCAGLLFGITGLIVAVPGYTAIKVILKEFLSENRLVKRLTQNL
ncbi:AI-2E family transporter [Robiginitalea sp.]|jgi:predicted PurR-regulated permease PerM|nr:AI-2E family transporter [Robiginitalea sp.]